MALSQEERLLIKQKPNPAVQSIKRFGGMVKENILDPVAQGLSYANPVNIAQRIPEYGRQIQKGVEGFDKRATERFKQNPGRVIGTQSGIIGPEYPETRASIAEPNMPLRNLPGSKLPEGNVDALMGANQTAPVVNLAETATKQPGYISPEGVAGMRAQKDLVVNQLNQPNQDIGDEVPETDIATLEGWRPKQDVLPGNDFNKANTEDYLKQTGYIPDADPRMVKRRQEAQNVQAGRKRFIADSEAGVYDVGGSGPTISKGLPVGRNLDRYEPLNSEGSRFQRGRDSVERIAGANIRQRSQRDLARLAATGTNQQTDIDLSGSTEAVSREDQIDNENRRREYGQSFELRGFPGLSPVVGEEIYDLTGSSGMDIDSLKALLSEELTKQGSNADFSKNPEEAISLLKNRIRYEQSR